MTNVHTPVALARRAPLARRVGAVLVLLAAAMPLAGCFDAPKTEDRWTRVDVQASNLRPYQALPAATSESVYVSTHITYRSILTGFAVAELRVADSISVADVAVHPDAPRVPMAHDIDRLLAGSRSLGRQTRAVTGWDHLVQPIDFTFRAVTPPDTGAVGRGVFLLVYLGSGELRELPGGRDSIIVTPFQSDAYQILPVGMEFSLGTPAP